MLGVLRGCRKKNRSRGALRSFRAAEVRMTFINARRYGVRPYHITIKNAAPGFAKIADQIADDGSILEGKQPRHDQR